MPLQLYPHIISDPDILAGQPVIEGAHIPASSLDAVQTWIATDAALFQLAHRGGAEFGLNAIDAFHVAAAEIAGATELITSEHLTLPLFRVTTLRVVSIHP